MKKGGFILFLSFDPPKLETSTNTVGSRCKMDHERARPQIVLILGGEIATIVESLSISDATSRQVWKKKNDV